MPKSFTVVIIDGYATPISDRQRIFVNKYKTKRRERITVTGSETEPKRSETKKIHKQISDQNHGSLSNLLSKLKKRHQLKCKFLIGVFEFS
jgi:hypothetical protein